MPTNIIPNNIAGSITTAMSDGFTNLGYTQQHSLNSNGEKSSSPLKTLFFITKLAEQLIIFWKSYPLKERQESQHVAIKLRRFRN
jgi:hypothetical protein